MEEKEKNSTSEELNTNNLFALASQEIEEEKRKENLENNKIEEDSDKTSLEDLFKIEKLSKDNENIDNDFSSILNDNQDIELEESTESENNTEVNSFLNVTSENKDSELKEENNKSVHNTEVNPFLNVIAENKDSELKEENNKSLDNPKVNPFLNVTAESKDEEPKEENNKSLDNPEVNPFLNVTPESKDQEPTEENNKSVDNTEVNPFLNITPENEEPELKEENNKPVDNTEVNPFLNVTADNKDTEPKEESNGSENNPETNPFFAGQDTSTNDNNIENPFFRKNNIQLNEKNIHTNNQKIDLSNVPHYDVKIQKKKPKKMKMILGVLSYAIFIWLLLIGIALLIYVGNVKIKEMKGDYTPPKYNAYVVLTGSMLPKIKVEDVVVTKKIEAKDLKEGDIITFASSDERYAGTIITHRIKKKYYDSTTGKYTFQSQGDNNNVADNALVEEDNIYGKVILKIPKLGYLQLFLASKGGWILVILIPCAVVVSFDIVKLFKMMAQKRKFKIVK